MQGTTQITMADQQPPSPDDTAKTIASIEAQLDDLLDAIDQHETTTPAEDASPTDVPPDAMPTDSDIITEPLDTVANDTLADPAPIETQSPEAISTVSDEQDATDEDIASSTADQILAEMNDAITDIEGETAASNQAESEMAPAQAPTSDPVDGELDLDAEIEALLAEQAIDPEVLSASETIAENDAVQAEADQEKLSQRAQAAADAIAQDAQSAEASTEANIDELLLENASQTDEFSDISDSDTQEQIALEIENLLAAEAAPPEPLEDDPSIDQIDQMLAEEIDTSDELEGDFQSVEDVADGIAPAEEAETEATDAEGASSSDVASELDNQPELAPPIATVEEDPAEDEALGKRPIWKVAFGLVDHLALRTCWSVNWPARKYLTPQWRSTVGYVALLNLAIGSALFAVGVAKLVF